MPHHHLVCLTPPRVWVAALAREALSTHLPADAVEAANGADADRRRCFRRPVCQAARMCSEALARL